ncbi:hypothetical protein [Streptomyces fuscichromogenes]|uniref:Uncharacterized protein n=1 Tax=Streptomyces fuscichromogenes TaxID=1324013 RepID=A0A917XQG8_9ACTN|nr:hypothetical protein [Streptomyces fuscichromogenes]GGN46456.1 hypothetical protein GCM10011578_099380 [Streptomyces fuscichromogenes]
MDNALLAQIEGVVGKGKAVVSADDDAVVALVQEAIKSGRTASFYLSREQARTLWDLHWTPELVKASRLEPVSGKEKERIESDLGIADIGAFRFGRFECKKGHEFSAYDFLQHGIREHGPDAVRAIFELKNTAFLRVNPYFAVNCATCDQLMEGGITYEGDTYAGCSYPDPPVCM